MNKSLKIVLLASIVALGLLFASCNNSNKDKNKHHTSDTTAVYACPMHPDVTGKKGDKCSKCGMSLELVEQTDEKGEKNNDEEKHDAHHH